MAGSGRSAGWSISAKTLAREPSNFLKGRWLMISTSSAMRSFSAASDVTLLAQAHDDPALRHLHARFSLGLVLSLQLQPVVTIRRSSSSLTRFIP